MGRGTSILKDFQVVMLPWLYIIDREGNVHEGTMFLKFDDLKETIGELLKEKDGGGA